VKLSQQSKFYNATVAIIPEIVTFLHATNLEVQITGATVLAELANYAKYFPSVEKTIPEIVKLFDQQHGSAPLKILSNQSELHSIIHQIVIAQHPPPHYVRYESPANLTKERMGSADEGQGSVGATEGRADPTADGTIPLRVSDNCQTCV